MDIKNQLKKTTHYLLKNKIDFEIYFYPPSELWPNRCIVVLEGNLKNKEIASTGIGNNFYTAYVKSISEFGEEIIRVDKNLKTRTGIAGGFFTETTISRAVSELIERDAFLFHYRTQTPMQYIKSVRINSFKIKIFKMVSISPDYHSFLAIDFSQIICGQKALHFSTATTNSQKDSIEKAINEFFSLFTYLKYNESNIKEMLNGNCGLNKKMDYNLMAIFDERNFEILKKVCNEECTTTISRNLISFKDNLVVNNIYSPIKFFKYYIAKHNELINFELGIPEQNSQSVTKDLYHPFW